MTKLRRAVEDWLSVVCICAGIGVCIAVMMVPAAALYWMTIQLTR